MIWRKRGKNKLLRNGKKMSSDFVLIVINREIVNVHDCVKLFCSQQIINLKKKNESYIREVIEFMEKKL